MPNLRSDTCVVRRAVTAKLLGLQFSQHTKQMRPALRGRPLQQGGKHRKHM